MECCQCVYSTGGLPSFLISSFLPCFGLHWKQREAVQMAREFQKDEFIAANLHHDYVFINSTKSQKNKS